MSAPSSSHALTLPAHTHPGILLARIELGTLHYVVVSGGSIMVARGAGPGTPGPIEWLNPGEETDLHPGDSVSETDGVVHFGANEGAVPVVILAALLLNADQPPAVQATPVAS